MIKNRRLLIYSEMRCHNTAVISAVIRLQYYNGEFQLIFTNLEFGQPCSITQLHQYIKVRIVEVLITQPELTFK